MSLLLFTKTGGWTCLGVELGQSEFVISLFLFMMTLVVVKGIRQGIYWMCGRIYGYLPEVLYETITPLTIIDTDLSFQMRVVLLDPFMSWFSVIFMMITFIFIEVVSLPNIYMQTLILYLCVLLGFIFPWRLFIRMFEWVSSQLYSFGWKFRPLIGLAVLFGSIFIYYVLFFIVLFACGPLITNMYSMFDISMRLLSRQIYIQHVQAYTSVFGFGLLYIIYDVLKEKIAQEL